MIASPSGGVLQGDRLQMSVEVRAGARLVLETQSATRLYRMPMRGARIDASFRVEADGWLRYVPDPYIPFAGSDTTIETTVSADSTATVLIGEVVAAGRVARGEIHVMRRFESSLTARDLDGRLRFTDATILEGGGTHSDAGMLGGYLALGSLYVIAAGADPAILREVAAADGAGQPFAGASTLPNQAGAWLRVLARDVETAGSMIRAATSRS
jgi:urease accessory protein